MTRDEARDTFRFGCALGYLVVVILAAMTGSQTVLTIALAPLAVVVVVLAMWGFGRWLLAAWVLANEAEPEPDMHFEDDPDQWRCLMVRTPHDPHRWWPSPGKVALCPGWPTKQRSNA